MAVSAGTAYLDIAPRISRDFSKQLTAQIVAPMGRTADKAGHETGRRLGGKIGEGLKRSSGTMLAPIRALGPAMAAAFGGAAIIGGIRSVVTAASDLNETVSKTRVVFGPAARQVEAFGATAAKSLGQSRQQALEAAATFGNLFVSMRIGQKPAADMSTRLVKLAGDLASFNNVDPAEALEALRSGLVGETEPLRRFGVNLNDAALRQEALRLGLVKTTKDVLPPAVKAQAAYSLILKQTKTAQGDFARTSDGLANRQRILKAQFEDLKGSIGRGLLPVAVAVAGFFVNKLIPAFGRLGPLVKTIVTGVKALIGAFKEGDVTSGGFVGVMERIGVALRGVWDWVTRTGRTIASFLIPIVGRVVAAVRPAIDAFVRGLTPGLKTLGTVIVERVWPVLKVVAQVIGGVLYLALTKVIPFILRLAGPVLGFLFRNLGVTIGWITNVIKWIGELGAKFLRWITGTKTTGDAMRELGRRISVFAGNAKREWDKIVAQVTGAIGAIKTAWKAGWNTVKDFAAAVWAGIKQKVANGINGVIGLINSFLRGVERIAGRLGLKVDLPVIPLVGTGPGGGGGGKGRAYQQGGIIPGSGTGDKELILAEPGEVVIPNRPGDRRRLMRDPKVLARLGLDVGGDPSMIRLLGFKTGGIIGRTQQWIRRQDPKPYVWGAAGPNAFDCSGLASAVYGMLTGRGGGSGQRYFTTGTIGPAQGFRAGRGTFTVGVTPGRGHMALNLAGLGAEARSSRTGIFVGSAARSVTSFARQFYLPQVGSKFTAGGGGFGALLAGLLAAILAPARAGLARLGSGSVIGQLGSAAGGKLLNAGAAWLQGRAFDDGGTLMPRWNLVYNGTGRPESLAPAAVGGPVVVNIYNPTGDPATVERAARRAVLAALSERDRRARKGGRI